MGRREVREREREKIGRERFEREKKEGGWVERK